MSVTFGGGGVAVVVVGTDISDPVVSDKSVSLVVVLQSVAAEVGADGTVVVGATGSWVDGGDSGTTVVVVVSSVVVVY